MEKRIASKLADKIGPYLDIKGRWNFGKSDKRRRDIAIMFRPKPVITIETVRLQEAARRRAIDELIAAIFPNKHTKWRRNS